MIQTSIIYIFQIPKLINYPIMIIFKNVLTSLFVFIWDLGAKSSNSSLKISRQIYLYVTVKIITIYLNEAEPRLKCTYKINPIFETENFFSGPTQSTTTVYVSLMNNYCILCKFFFSLILLCTANFIII